MSRRHAAPAMLRTGLAVSVLVLTAFFLAAKPAGVRIPVQVATYHNNISRQGLNANETLLTPRNVNSEQFGKLYSYEVDGWVYAQPLFLASINIPGRGMHNVAYVATEHDSVYAFDADARPDAAPLWRRSLLNRGATTVPSADVACADLVPEIGITGTPVIDTASGTLYVVAKSKEGGRYLQRLHALDIATGAEKFGGPIEIRASYPGDIQFDALRENQRAGLLLHNGYVFIAWASYCDMVPYYGWVLAYQAKTLRPAAAWNSAPNARFGGIWQSGGAPAADPQGIYVSVGNGNFDANEGGLDYGNSVLKLGMPTHGQLPILDYFTPYNQNNLNADDSDIGSGGVLLLPDPPATAPGPHLLVQAGKEGTIHLLDRNHMGGYDPGGNHQIVEWIPRATNGFWGTPAWWNNLLYLAGSKDKLKAFVFDGSVGRLLASPISQSTTAFGYPGAIPAISANGSRDGIVWAVQTDAYVHDGAQILHAYDATDLRSELYNSAQNPARDDPGGAVKFTVPTVANGKVYLGGRYRLSVYGLF